MLFCALAVFGTAGCAAEAEVASPGAGGPGATGAPEGTAEDELREQSIKIVGAGGLHVDDRPALKEGAAGSLTCAADGARVVLNGRERITCKRDREVLEIILHTADKRAVVLHRPDGLSSDRRTFFACTTSGNGPGDLPSTLGCTKKVPSTGSGHGGLASPFASTVSGLKIPNSHAVGPSGLLFRGMAPRGDQDLADLVSLGVGAVLVFKNQTGSGSDVADEMQALRDRGLASSRVANIPFKWKELGSFEETCEQTVEGLKFLASNMKDGKKTFFHCTVGEDRTGLLAAAHRLLTEPALTADQAFDEEMCERGYGAGNPLKPAFVKGQLASGLTPFYRKLSWMIESGKLRADALDAAACASDPEADPAFAASAPPAARFACGTSTQFVP